MGRTDTKFDNASAQAVASTKSRILLVDRDRARATRIAARLADDFECAIVHGFEEALALLVAERYWGAVVAYGLGGDGSGIELLEELRHVDPRAVRALYSERLDDGLVSDARRLARVHDLLEAGASGFLDALHLTLRDLHEVAATPEADGEPAERRPPWFAISPVTQRFLRDLREAADGGGPVFLQGEPGSGKHLAAETLRRWRHERIRAGADGSVRAWEISALGKAFRRPPVRIVRVPPLRERVRDLPALADAFLAHAARDGSAPPRLGPDAVGELMRRDWAGNVKELHAVLGRASAATHAHVEIRAADLPAEIPVSRNPSQVAKDEGQLHAVLRQLRAAGSVRGAAGLEHVTRANYMRMLKRLGVLRADAHIDDSGS